MNISYQTHPGMVRTSNEDTLFVDEQLGLFIVADGMGGHNAGEVASITAVNTISDFVRAGSNSSKTPESLLKEALLAAHEQVLALAHTDDRLKDMGTTIVAAMFSDGRVTVAHVGDSRAYQICRGRIAKLTHDHSFIADWVRDGLISPLEARTHTARHGLTMALGVDEDVQPEIKTFPWVGKGCLLLCSDGLTDMIEDEEILQAIEQTTSLKEACNALVMRANDKGGEDNVTVVLVSDDDFQNQV